MLLDNLNFTIWSMAGIPQGMVSDLILFISLAVALVFITFTVIRFTALISTVCIPGFMSKLVWTLTPLVIVITIFYMGDQYSKGGELIMFEGDSKEWIVDGSFDLNRVA